MAAGFVKLSLPPTVQAIGLLAFRTLCHVCVTLFENVTILWREFFPKLKAVEHSFSDGDSGHRNKICV